MGNNIINLSEQVKLLLGVRFEQTLQHFLYLQDEAESAMQVNIFRIFSTQILNDHLLIH